MLLDFTVHVGCLQTRLWYCEWEEHFPSSTWTASLKKLRKTPRVGKTWDGKTTSCHLMDVKHHTTWKIHQKVGRTFGQFGQFNFSWKVSSFIQWSVADLCWPRTPTDSIGETCHTGCEGQYNTLVGVRGHRICQEPVPDPWKGPLTPSQLSVEGMCCIFWHGTAGQMERQLLDGKMQTSIEIYLKRTSEMCCNFTSKCKWAVLNPLLDLIGWWMLVVSAGFILAIASWCISDHDRPNSCGTIWWENHPWMLEFFP